MFKKCNVCHEQHEWRKPPEESGNKIVDDFIRYTRINSQISSRMEFASFGRFKNVQFIAEGGFSKIYRATWWNARKGNMTDALKKLNNSKNISFKELNEVQYSVLI